MDEQNARMLVGRYVVGPVIASGGMGTVHLGRLSGAGGFARGVAIKRLHPHMAKDDAFVRMFLDEARIASRVRHPNVVATLDVVESASELLLVMEYVSGESLAKLLSLAKANESPVPLPVALAIVAGALHGLEAAHAACDNRGEPLGIVHRDVSPQNVLVGIDGIARVVDFGVATAGGRQQVTTDGRIKGKIAYMPPERLSGAVATTSCDTYALGVVLWECLTGDRLFDGASPVAIAAQVRDAQVEPPSSRRPEIPPDVDRFVSMAIARQREQRYPSARAMLDALARLAVRPASPAEIGAWVDELAGGTIQRRAAQLAELERL